MTRRNVHFHQQFADGSINGVYVLLTANEVQSMKLRCMKKKKENKTKIELTVQRALGKMSWLTKHAKLLKKTKFPIFHHGMILKQSLTFCGFSFDNEFMFCS